MAAIRRASAVWEGDLLKGHGSVSATTSKVFTDLPVTWAARTEESNGLTSPEELVAAAHSACYIMSFSNMLAKAGTPAQRLEVTAAVTFDAPNVTSSALTVRGWVAGIDEAAFKKTADEAKDGCPISKALRNNVALSVEATLVS